MKVTGLTISNTVMVLKNGLMDQNMMVNMSKERNTAKVASLGLMAQLILEILKII